MVKINALTPIVDRLATTLSSEPIQLPITNTKARTDTVAAFAATGRLPFFFWISFPTKYPTTAIPRYSTKSFNY